jgi:transcriptional regulator with XRE-family HTH domain
MPRKRIVGRTERAIKIAAAIGETLREARAAAGITQADVADAVGVSRQLYADIEAGKTALRMDQLDGIARAVGVTPWTLVRRSLDLMAASPVAGG